MKTAFAATLTIVLSPAIDTEGEASDFFSETMRNLQKDGVLDWGYLGTLKGYTGPKKVSIPKDFTEEDVANFHQIPRPILVITNDAKGVVEDIKQIMPPNGKEAERVFIEKCAEEVPNWHEYTQEDIDAILDDGYYTVNGKYICIYHL